jgi:dTDP-4-amino-4,6-dideoxygalactose transaminase
MGIQLFVPTFHVEECLNEIKECLEIGWPGMGFKTNKFEDEWKKYTGFTNAHFLNSATAGLYLAFDILKEKYNWNDGDEVITTGLTFVSTNHAILLSNLKPVFADVDDTLCLNPIDVKSKITSKTRAVLYVGLGGNTGELEKIILVCKENNLKLVLDAAHMAGTKLHNKTPGIEADVVVYSFQAVKNLPTADSGMICFKEEELDKIARKKSWLGINKDTFSRTAKDGNYKWMYDVEYVGQKYHGNSIMAAIGLVQLKYLDEDNEKRRSLSDIYDTIFENHNNHIKRVRFIEGCQSSRHLYQIIVKNRDELLSFLNENEIYPGVHYRDNTQYKMYKQEKNTCINTEYYSNHLISLPLHLRLTEADIKHISNLVVEFCRNNEF